MNPLRLRVNDEEHVAVVEDRASLADVLREECGLTGTRLGCEHGVCGACTVLVGARPVRSCLVLARQADGAAVTTIEGVGATVVQEAFREAHGLQCGFCTSGMLVTAVALLDRDPDPSEETVREVMHGNLCRCTGYDQVVESVLLAAERLRGQT